jgi:hypothetical protein
MVCRHRRRRYIASVRLPSGSLQAAIGDLIAIWPTRESVNVMWGRVRPILGRYVAAQTVVVLLSGPYLASISTEAYRYRNAWQMQDTVRVLALLVLAAVVCVAAGELVRASRRSWPRVLFDHAFVLALGAGLLTTLWFHTNRSVGYSIGKMGMEMRTAWLVLAGLVGYSLARPGSRLVYRARWLCMAISPAGLILCFHLLRMNTYPSPCDPLDPVLAARASSSVQPAGWNRAVSSEVPVSPAAATPSDPASSRPAGPIHILVFDGWSYERTFRDGMPRCSFTHLGNLSRQSVVFQDAHSPGDCTEVSMPRLMNQTDLEPAVRDGRVGFIQDDRFVQPRECSSLYSAAEGRGYRNVMIGFSLPYAMWIGYDLDACRSYLWSESRSRWTLTLGGMGYGVIQYWTDPWFSWLYHRRIEAARARGTLQNHEDIRRDVRSVIVPGAGRVFMVCHHPLPHFPYIPSSACDPASPSPLSWRPEDSEGYERNLAHLDDMIGEYVDAMRQAGLFDDALIVLTSDHTWRDDPRRPLPQDEAVLTHVPLVVKFPRQSQRLAVADRFETRRLKTLIDYALRPDADIRGVGRVVESAMKYGGVSRLERGLASVGSPAAGSAGSGDMKD